MVIPPEDPVALRVQADLLRAAGPGRRAALARSLSASVISMSREAIRRRHPEYTETDVLLRFVALNYGAELADRLRARLDPARR